MKDVVDAQPPSARPSPIETDSPEILREIFQVLACEDGIVVEFSESGRLKCYSLVFTLSRVCSLWRNISLSQPSLWSALLFDADIESNLAQEMIAKDKVFLRELLQRSSNVMLCLTVERSETSRGLQPAIFDALWVFAEHAHRYRVLTFRFEYFQVMNGTWEIFKSTRPPAGGRIPDIYVDEGHFPHLESLTLEYHDLWHNLDSFRVKPFSHQCPQLRTFHIASLYSYTMIPGLNLTTLTIDCYHGSLAILLANHPSLQSLTIHEIAFPPLQISIPNTPIVPEHPIYHTNLKTLIWGPIKDLDDSPRAWDLVYLPNLTGLAVALFESVRPEWYESGMEAFLEVGGSFEAMKAMLVRSKCTLENVSLYDIPEDMVAEFFRDVSMKEGCRNGRTVYDFPDKVPTVVPSSADLPESGIIAVAEA